MLLSEYLKLVQVGFAVHPHGLLQHFLGLMEVSNTMTILACVNVEPVSFVACNDDLRHGVWWQVEDRDSIFVDPAPVVVYTWQKQIVFIDAYQIQIQADSNDWFVHDVLLLAARRALRSWRSVSVSGSLGFCAIRLEQDGDGRPFAM